MASNILNIGKSALAAAQVGISTTGHNIANASTPGYSRQVVIQGSAQAQNLGFGYIGQGTEVQTITRIYNDLLSKQISTSQSNSSELSTYATQMSQIDNLLADSNAGLSPAMQNFFASVQALASNPGDAPSRQAMLSSAQSLATRFQSLDDRLTELSQGVNSQLNSSVTLTNSYATQIARLNDVIQKALNADPNNTPNDLMDQRDLLVNELSKQIKTTVVKDGNNYNVFIGNGLPLVVNAQAFGLVTVPSNTDGERLEIAYKGTNGSIARLSENSITGGVIGGLVKFRSESLDTTRNQLGQIASVFAETFNAQHEQALDKNGNVGGAFFTTPVPKVNTSSLNTGNAVVTAQIVDAGALTSSDYRLQYDGSQYSITRLSDNTVQQFSSMPATVDGVTFQTASGSMNAGDDFLVQPTINGAATFSVALTDINKIAVGAPALTAAASTGNTGSGTISTPVAGTSYSGSPLTGPITMTYNTGGTLTLLPATMPVTVTVGSTSTTYPAGTAVPFTSGATVSVGGLSTVLSGPPANGDSFTITPSASGAVGDNRNGLLLATLQSKGTLNGGTVSYSSAFGQLTTSVGNKSRELQVSAKAESAVLSQVTTSLQSESGVNLDEEATNLMRYQQAYQAAGKVMQIANQMFDTLLSIGG